MGRPVDERIAKLSMDNSSFKQHSEESIGILSKLSGKLSGVKNLNLDKSVDSVNNLNTSSNRIDFSKLLSAAETVTHRFSGLGIMAARVFSNIADGAMQAGVSMVKSLSLNGVKDGFNEYELKMRSIQTILSNTQGKSSLEDVKNVLSELNTYADQTVYSFADMTSNIGTFTAAGVNLQDSATAIKGISNLAAASGSNTQQASTAMYQLSQALANGKVNLQDWNSVVNAGMGGKLFQNALLDTAKAMGKNIDASKSFRDSLQDGWLTTDVLITTLRQFANDQSMLEAATKVRTFTQLVDTAKEAVGSGWATTWEKLFGDFEEAGDMWTKANDVISASINKSADSRNALIQSFVDMGGRAKLIDIVANSFSALAQLLTTVKGAFRDVFPAKTADDLFKMVSNLADFTAKLKMSEETAGKVHIIFQGLFSAFSIGITIVKQLAEGFIKLIPKSMSGDIMNIAVELAKMVIKLSDTVKASKSIQETFSMLGKASNQLYEDFKKSLGRIPEIFNHFVETVQGLWAKVSPVLNKLKELIKNTFMGINGDDIITGGIIAVIVTMVTKLSGLGVKLSNFAGKLSGLVSKASDAIGIFGDLGDALKSFTGAVKAGTLLTIAAAVGTLAISLGILGNMKFSTVAQGLLAISSIMMLLDKSLSSMMKSAGGILEAGGVALVLSSIASSILVLSGALAIIAHLNPSKLAQGLGGMAAMIVMLVSAIRLLSSQEKMAVVGAGAMLSLSVSVNLMALAVSKLGSLKAGDMEQGLIGLGAILLELAAFVLVVQKADLNPATATSVLIIASSLGMIANAVKSLGSMKFEEMTQGLTGLGVILLELAATAQILGDAGSIGGAASIVAMAAAVNMLVPPLRDIGNLNPAKLAQGLIGLGLGLLELVKAAKAMEDSKGGAGALLVMGAAINLMVPAISTLGHMPWQVLVTGLVGFAAALGTAAVASKLIGATGSAALLSFAAAVGAIGLAVSSILIALSLFLRALMDLSTLGIDAVNNIIRALGAFIDGLAGLAPKIAHAAVSICSALLDALAELAPKLADKGLEAIEGFLEGVNKHISKIIDIGVQIIEKLMEGLGKAAPRLLEAAVKMIIDLVNGLANAIRKNSKPIVDAVFSLVESILEVLVDALVKIGETLFGWIPGVGDKMSQMGDSAKEALRKSFGVKDAEDIGNDVGKGYADGFGNTDTTASAEKVNANLKGNLVMADFGPEGTKNMESFSKGILSDKTTEAAASQKVQDARTALGLNDFMPEGMIKGEQFAKGLESANTKPSGEIASQKAKEGTSVPDFTPEGILKGNQFNNGLESKSGEAQQTGKSVSSSAKSGAGTPDFTPEGILKGNQFNNGLESKSGEANRVGNTISSAAMSGANAPDFSWSGINKGNQFTGGVVSADGWGAGNSLANSANNGTQSVSAYNSGGYFGDGFVRGIGSMLASAASAGAALGAQALNALNSNLGIHSPSKKALKSGGFFGEGFILGIDSLVNDAKNSASELGEQSLEGLNDSINRINDTMINSMDLNPVITPVLDTKNLTKLSNLSANSVISGNFASNTPVMNLDSGLFRSIAVSTQVQNQSDDSKKLSDKLDNLIKKIDNLLFNLPKNIIVETTIDKQLVGKAVAPITKKTNDEREQLLKLIEGVK